METEQNWPRQNKRLGIFIMASSGVVALLISLYFLLQGSGIPLTVLAIPAVIFLTGLLVMLTGFVELMELDDEVMSARQLLADDINDLRRGRITRTWKYVGIAILCLIAELWLLDFYQKWNAAWWGIVNVFLTGGIVVLAACAILVRTRWFQDRNYRVQGWLSWVVVGGFILCAVLGISNTEPNYSGKTRQERVQISRSEQFSQLSRVGQAGYFNFFSGGSDLLGGDCDGEICLVIALVVVVIMCVVGSLFIPHFWVIGTMLTCALMCLIAVRELLFTERKWSET